MAIPQQSAAYRGVGGRLIRDKPRVSRYHYGVKSAQGTISSHRGRA